MSEAASDYGVITEAGTIRFERLLPGPVERVWEYLVDSDKRRTWLASGEMEERKGAEFELVWRNSELSSENDPVPDKYAGQEEYHARGRVIRIDPPHLLVTTWEGEGEVTYELAEHGDKVLLTLTHRHIQGHDPLIGIAGGWHTHLNLLRAELEGSERFPFWKTHMRLEGEYEGRLS